MKTDYKPNSHKHKNEMKASAEEKKKVTKVAKGSIKKKSEARKFADVFISENVSNIKDYIFMDVLVPAIKKTIENIVVDGIDMLLYGEAGHTRRKSGSKVSYSKCYDRRDDRFASESRRSSRFDYDEIKFETRGEAEAVLDEMEDIIDAYSVVTVSDLYDMADLTSPYTANRYGWSSLRSAEVIRTREGYFLKLPKPKPID